jgi:hypothetical protein
LGETFAPAVTRRKKNFGYTNTFGIFVDREVIASLHDPFFGNLHFFTNGFYLFFSSTTYSKLHPLIQV